MKKLLCIIIAVLFFTQPCLAASEEPVLSDDAQEKVTDLLDLLASVDAGGNGMYFSENREINPDLLDRFLTWSVWMSVPFIDGTAPEITELSDGTSGWKIPEDKLKDYLQNSLGRSDYTMSGNMKMTDGNIEIGGFTPSAVYGHERPEISKVSRISENRYPGGGNRSICAGIFGRAAVYSILQCFADAKYRKYVGRIYA